MDKGLTPVHWSNTGYGCGQRKLSKAVVLAAALQLHHLHKKQAEGED
jgi:hypothetical protein